MTDSQDPLLVFITFLLAPIGYAGLALTAVRAARGRMSAMLWRLTTVVIVTHVLMVWTVRYEWQFSEATRNGYVGFALFHGALVAIMISLVARDRVARALVIGAFGVVTVGAVGATFRYDVVANYRIPVLVCAMAGVTGLALAQRSARASRLGMAVVHPGEVDPG